MKKKIIFFILKIVFTVGLLGFFLYRTDLAHVATSLQDLSIYMVPVIMALYFLGMALISYKWKLLLPDYSLLFLMKYNLIGVYYSTVLPSQITGEVVKSYILGKKGSDPHKIIASVFVDKVTGLISILVISIAGVILTSQKVPHGIIYSIIILLALIIIILMGIRLKAAYMIIAKMLRFLSDKIPKTQYFFNHLIQFIDEWNIFSGKIKILLMNVLVGIVFHFMAVLINYLLANEVGIIVSYFDWCWIYGLLSIVLLIPVSIAGIGLRDGTLISVLGIFGVTSGKAVALSLVLLGFLVVLAITGFCLNISSRFDKKQVLKYEPSTAD